jgi:hypothetical protein
MPSVAGIPLSLIPSYNITVKQEVNITNYMEQSLA